MKKRILLPLMLPVLFSGCASSMNTGASDLSCSIVNQGKKGRCMSMSQAWEASEDYRPEDGFVYGGRAAAVTPFLPETIPNMAAIDEPKPLLMPAQVLRVWINAYEDADGNLAYPSRVFSEVTPRRWNVGYSAAQAVQSSRIVTPLIVKEQPQTTTVSSASQVGVSSSDAKPSADDGTQQETGASAQTELPVPTQAAEPSATLPAGVLTPPLQ